VEQRPLVKLRLRRRPEMQPRRHRRRPRGQRKKPQQEVTEEGCDEQRTGGRRLCNRWICDGGVDGSMTGQAAAPLP